MNNLAVADNRILAMSQSDIDKVDQLTTFARTLPAVELETLNVLHGGMYARTLKIPAGTVVTGALIKVATILIIQGSVALWIDDKAVELHGYNVFAASAMRKQAIVALTEVNATMIFPSKAVTIAQAEDEFTDEAENLLTRKNNTNVKTIITGE